MLQDVKEKFNDRPVCHMYSFTHIFMFIQLVISTSIRMRSADRAMEFFLSFFELDLPSPSWYSGRLWILRIGLYKLERPKQVAEDWIWIIDHTVQLGKEKCLVILGIRQENLPSAELHLTHEEMEPIALFPVAESNGDIVFSQLEKAAEKTGVPRQIISDYGSDLKSGVEKFRQKHKNIVHTYDIKHKGAAIFRRELENKPAWQEFTRQAAQTSKKVQQTDLAFLSPPNQRSKARYMNVDSLVKWGNETIAYLNQNKLQHPDNFENSAIFQRIGWLYDFETELKKWKSLIDVILETIQYINVMGLYRGVHVGLALALFRLPHTRLSRSVSFEMIRFVKEQQLGLKRDERMPGSSEIVESVIGKYKNLQHDQVKGGFTAMILGLAASVSELTLDTVRDALDAVSVKRLREWLNENVGTSVFTRKKEMRKDLKEQKLGEKLGCFCT